MTTVPLHEFMAANRDEILANCVAELRDVSPQYTDVEVTGHLGAFLDEMIRALQHAAGLPVSSPLPQKSDAAESQLDAAVTPALERLEVQPLLCELRDGAVPERGIEVKVVADESLEVTADESLLVSALGNLLQNAIKFTRAGGHVVLRARKQGDAVVIEVEDECGGLPEGVQEELFQPFVQLGKDRRGLGLGLTITRDAVIAMGGEIGVRNLPGHGCVFAVRL